MAPPGLRSDSELPQQFNNSMMLKPGAREHCGVFNNSGSQESIMHSNTKVPTYQNHQGRSTVVPAGFDPHPAHKTRSVQVSRREEEWQEKSTLCIILLLHCKSAIF